MERRVISHYQQPDNRERLQKDRTGGQEGNQLHAFLLRRDPGPDLKLKTCYVFHGNVTMKNDPPPPRLSKDLYYLLARGTTGTANCWMYKACQPPWM